MDHFTFIAASYAVSLAGLGLLVLWLVLDNRAQRRALDELEARGLTRRSRAGASARSPAPSVPDAAPARQEARP